MFRFGGLLIPILVHGGIVTMPRPHTVTDDDRASTLLPCTHGQLAVTPALTSQDYDDVYASVKEIYNGLTANCDGDDCPRNKFAGCLLRLTSHDFLDSLRASPGVTWLPETDFLVGGQDGCITLNAADHAGLSYCLEHFSVVDAYQPHCHKVNIADFIVIAGEAVTAITSTCEKSAKQAFKYDFKYGRRWCGALPTETGAIQSGDDHEVVHMQKLWDTGFGPDVIEGPNGAVSLETLPVTVVEKIVVSTLFYNVANPYNQAAENSNTQAQECNITYKKIGNIDPDLVLGTALMGSHCIGVQSKVNVGYEGFFGADPYTASIFNNGLFTRLLYRGYEPLKFARGKSCKPIAKGYTEAPACGDQTESRCPSEYPYCTKGKCVDTKVEPATDIDVPNSFTSSDCGGNKYTWATSDELSDPSYLGTMLNTDMIWAHNWDTIYAEEVMDVTGCCSYFSEKWLTDNNLPTDKACKNAEKCCSSKDKPNCNTMPVKSKINAGAYPGANAGKPFSRFAYGDAPYSSHLLKAVAKEWKATTTGAEDLGGNPGGISLDAVVEFARSEEKWLKYYHKSWYLATTSGQINLKRLETTETVQKGATASTECFSWGCEQFVKGKYYAEGFSFVLGDSTDAFNVCDYKFKALVCTDEEEHTAEKVKADADKSVADAAKKASDDSTGNSTAIGAADAGAADGTTTAGGRGHYATDSVMFFVGMHLFNFFI